MATFFVNYGAPRFHLRPGLSLHPAPIRLNPAPACSHSLSRLSSRSPFLLQPSSFSQSPPRPVSLYTLPYLPSPRPIHLAVSILGVYPAFPCSFPRSHPTEVSPAHALNLTPFTRHTPTLTPPLLHLPIYPICSPPPLPPRLTMKNNERCEKENVYTYSETNNTSTKQKVGAAGVGRGRTLPKLHWTTTKLGIPRGIKTLLKTIVHYFLLDLSHYISTSRNTFFLHIF